MSALRRLMKCSLAQIVFSLLILSAFILGPVTRDAVAAEIKRKVLVLYNGKGDQDSRINFLWRGLPCP